MAAGYSQDALNLILPFWHSLLTRWALDGSLVAAAEEALNLADSNAKDNSQKQLQSLVSQLAAEDYSSIPAIVLLPSDDMNGAIGAYAFSTGEIYLNSDSLTWASRDQELTVLTEELGHHLDNLLNTMDTPGDEGAHFSAALLKKPNRIFSGQQPRKA